MSAYIDTFLDGSAQGPSMVVIPAGKFLMGSTDGEYDERPQHEVTIEEPFAMGQYAVTFDEYDAFCRSTKRELARADFGRGMQPVINVSWHDATDYCQWLSDMTGKNYCLPSEAQWEYACRAGTTTPWNTGEELTHGQANFGQNNKGTVAVDHYKQPNAFGLYQMHGNVWEWCMNVDPVNDRAAIAGGSWFWDATNCRSSGAIYVPRDRIRHTIGFRVFRPE